MHTDKRIDTIIKGYSPVSGYHDLTMFSIHPDYYNVNYLGVTVEEKPYLHLGLICRKLQDGTFQILKGVEYYIMACKEGRGRTCATVLTIPDDSETKEVLYALDIYERSLRLGKNLDDLIANPEGLKQYMQRDTAYYLSFLLDAALTAFGYECAENFGFIISIGACKMRDVFKQHGWPNGIPETDNFLPYRGYAVPKHDDWSLFARYTYYEQDADGNWQAAKTNIDCLPEGLLWEVIEQYKIKLSL